MSHDRFFPGPPCDPCNSPDQDPMRDPLIGRAPFEHSGPCCPGGPLPPNPYQPGVPNPVPVMHHHHPPIPPRPLNEMYVLKKQFNEVIKNIAEADIYEDKTTAGTTASVGGITAGTKLGKITFAKFIQMCLFPTTPGGTYVTQTQLNELLADVAFSGSFDDLEDVPESFDYDYPCENEEGQTTLLSTVVNPVGGFVAGDSLKGMTMAEIIEKMLCKSTSTDDYRSHFMPYAWISEEYNLASGTLEIAAENIKNHANNLPGFRTIVEDYLDAESPEAFFATNMKDGRYKLYALRPNASAQSENKYNCLIALSNTSTSESPQVTNPTWTDVPANLSWTLDVSGLNATTHAGAKIVLSGSGITTDMIIVLVCTK
jgi:hypothetical protein